MARELLLVRDSAYRVLEVRHIYGRFAFFFYAEVACRRACLLRCKFNCYC